MKKTLLISFVMIFLIGLANAQTYSYDVVTKANYTQIKTAMNFSILGVYVKDNVTNPFITIVYKYDNYLYNRTSNKFYSNSNRKQLIINGEDYNNCRLIDTAQNCKDIVIKSRLINTMDLTIRNQMTYINSTINYQNKFAYKSEVNNILTWLRSLI